MSLLLGQLVYTSFAEVGYKTIVSADIPQEIQQAFIQQVVYQHWDAFNPPSSGYQAAYLYQVTSEQSLFGWLYNDGLDDLGRGHVPYFICYYLAQQLHVVQLESILICLRRGPVALLDRRSLPAQLEPIVLSDLWTYQPARNGVEIASDMRDRTHAALKQGQLLDLFIPVEPKPSAQPNHHSHQQQSQQQSIPELFPANPEQTAQHMKLNRQEIATPKNQVEPQPEAIQSTNHPQVNQSRSANSHRESTQIKPLNESVILSTTTPAFFATTSPGNSQTSQSTRIALLIGVSDYGLDFNSLPKAPKDVAAMQQILQNPAIGNFTEVRTLINPNRQVMEEAIETLFSDCQPQDLILLYFSGHGIKDDNGKLYLATSITRKNERQKLVKSSAVLASFIQATASESRCQHQSIILECCFNETITDRELEKDDEPIDIHNQFGREGRVILVSSTSSQCFFEQNESVLSTYTHYLVEGMETGAADLDKNGTISIKELHDYASMQVKKAIPAMQPEIYGVEDYHQFILAQAPIDDPKWKYREKAELCISRGHISIINRNILNVIRDHLGLQPEEAAVIEARVLEPYREYQKRLYRYVQELVQATYHESPLSYETRKRLKHLQLLTGLRDEDVRFIEAEITRRIQIVESKSHFANNNINSDIAHTEEISVTPINEQLKAKKTVKPDSIPVKVSHENNSEIDSSNTKVYMPFNPKLWLFIGTGATIGILTLTGAIYARTQWQNSQRLKTIQTLAQERNYEECISLAKTLAHNNAQTALKQCEAGVNWQNVQTQNLGRHLATVWSLALSSDGQTLASGGGDNTVKIWNLGNGELMRTLSGHSDRVWSVTLSPAGQTLASGSSDDTIKIWNLGSGELIRTLSGHSGTVWSVAFNLDGQRLMSGSSDNKIKIWNLGNGKLIRTLSGHSGAVRVIALSPDGQTLISGSSDKTIKIWNLGNGKLIRTLSGHQDRVISLALSPDGKMLASGSQDQTIKIWNVSSGQLLHTLSGLSDAVGAIAISPNGRILASGVGKMLKIWNLNTFEMLNTLPTNSNNITAITFSKNGKQIVSGNQDGTIKILSR